MFFRSSSANKIGLDGRPHPDGNLKLASAHGRGRAVSHTRRPGPPWQASLARIRNSRQFPARACSSSPRVSTPASWRCCARAPRRRSRAPKSRRGSSRFPAREIAPAAAIALEAARKAGAPYDGVVALGCVIRGETYHFEIVANESARALSDLSLSQRLPLGNGILTVENEEQAIARADPKQGDKGADAALAALALIRLAREWGGRR